MPSALVFARKADDQLASFVKHVDKFVGKHKDKNAHAVVILLGDKGQLSTDLEKIAKDKKLENVPLTVSVDGDKGPKAYKIAAKVPVTVVVYDSSKVVTASFAYEKIDEKAEKESFKEFAKVVGVDPPKDDEFKETTSDTPPSTDAPKTDAPKTDEPKKDEPKKDEPKKDDPMAPK